jgi:hypothetical protein
VRASKHPTTAADTTLGVVYWEKKRLIDFALQFGTGS